MANVLIIDDDQMLCSALAAVIGKMGHVPSVAFTLKQGIKKALTEPYEVVILDVWLPDGNGLEAIPEIREAASAPEVIILTGAADPDGAELATRSGAWDYLTKPPALSKIKLSVQRAVDYHRERKSKQPFMALRRNGIIGDTQALRNCLNTVAQAASTDSNVLITGETGTGKELFARAIHDNSHRADQPFVVVDCASLPEKLVESVLFGHERGAFTGADRKSEGLIKQADKGTLFLDEVGELPIQLQKTFLRVLQEHCFRSVGGRKEVCSDFRLVAATNRSLEKMIEEWTFREDLFFRLRTIHIELPPLREMKADIRELTCFTINEYCQRLNIERKGYSPEFLDSLFEYSWPGNVRELISALEHAVSMAGVEPILMPRHLPMEIRVQLARASLTREHPQAAAPVSRRLDPDRFPKLKDFRAEAVAELERQYLTELMAVTGGRIRQACEVADLSRARLYALLNAHNVSREV
ncbi:MAG: sigma-54-dependent transcriptional regulator [Desulfohalobiaceae bacterium]